MDRFTNDDVSKEYGAKFAEIAKDKANFICMGIVANNCQVPISHIIYNCMENTNIFKVSQMSNIKSIEHGTL